MPDIVLLYAQLSDKLTRKNGSLPISHEFSIAKQSIITMELHYNETSVRLSGVAGKAFVRLSRKYFHSPLQSLEIACV